jgi:hypothetical protein
MVTPIVPIGVSRCLPDASQVTSSESEMQSHFQRLCDDLPLARQMPATIESPNPEDDRLVRLALAGYSFHQSVDPWGKDELDFVTRRRREVEDFNPLYGEFVCLASGYLLGLYQAGKCRQAECALFEAQLSGFMWQHSERFTAA